MVAGVGFEPTVPFTDTTASKAASLSLSLNRHQKVVDVTRIELAAPTLQVSVASLGHARPYLKVVDPEGIKPSASCLQGRRSIN